MQEIPTSGLAKFITDLAKEHNIAYAKTCSDQLAEKFTELSGDEVVLDDIECLIIALERAGAINSEDVVPLHVNYLREKLKITSTDSTWQCLVLRNKRMFIKDMKLRASTVYYDMIANELSIAETADNFSISESAVNEAVRWCELNADLLEVEANEESLK